MAELWHEYGGTTVSSTKRDYFFFLPHRTNVMYGLQNFERFQQQLESAWLYYGIGIVAHSKEIKGHSKIHGARQSAADTV